MTNIQSNDIITDITTIVKYIVDSALDLIESDDKNKKNRKKIYKLFPKFNDVILNNLKIDDESISYITNPYDSKKIINIIIKHVSNNVQCNEQCNENTIVDCTAGVGGDTIMFCKTFRSVISIELNEMRCELLKHNLKEYGLKNVTVLNGDSSIIIKKIQNVDIIYIDPPWGGKEYKTKENIRLLLSDIQLETFISNCFDEEKMTSIPKILVLKMPKNYDIKYLFDTLHDNFDIYVYKLRKLNILILEKIKNI